MPKVKVFTTRTCPFCQQLKAHLKENNIDFEEVAIDTDVEGAKESVDTCGSMGVPCTHITLDDGTEEHVLGFDKAKIDSLLGIS